MSNWDDLEAATGPKPLAEVAKRLKEAGERRARLMDEVSELIFAADAYTYGSVERREALRKDVAWANKRFVLAKRAARKALEGAGFDREALKLLCS